MFMLMAGTGAPPVPSISPASSAVSGGTSAHNFTPTASVDKGAPSAYSWGVLTGVGGSITSGGTTASPTLTITDPVQGDGQQPITFYCDITVDGVVYRATCNYSWNWI